MENLKSSTKRIISIFLCMVMLLTVFLSAPFSAGAEMICGKNTVRLTENITVTNTGDMVNDFTVKDSSKQELADTAYSSTMEHLYEKIEKDGVIYAIDENNELYITGVQKDQLSEQLVISKEVDGYPVVGITRDAFRTSNNLKSVFIPNSIKTIGESAFSDCDNLTSVVFEDEIKIKEISAWTFTRCESLESIVIPASVEKIEDNAFDCCSNLEKVTFAKNSQLTYIGVSSFGGCVSLESIEIPQSCKTIEDGAFLNCYRLSEVTLNEGLKEVVEGAFLNCFSMEQIYIPDSIEKIGFAAFGCLEDNAEYYAITDFTVIGSLNSLADDYAATYSMKYVLPAPILSSVNNTTDGVKITFKHLSDVTGKYRIYKKTTGKSWSKVADVTGTSYTDKSVSSGTKYTYTVKYIGSPAYSTYDKDGLSILYLATPKVSKISNTNDGAKITFSKVAGADKYNVYVKSGSSWKKLGETTGTSYTHKDAKSGTTYSYRVRAYDSTRKYVSAYKSAGDSNKFIAPPVIKSVTNSSNGPKISWDKVSGAVNYRVFVKSGSSWKKLKDTTSTSYTHTSAESGKTYIYTVRCISSTGKSYVSGYYTKGTKNMFLSMPIVSKISNTNDGAKLTWGKVEGADKYNVYVKSGSSWKKLGETTGTSYTHKDTKSGTTYSYRVRAYDSTREYVSAYKSAGDSNTFIASPVIKSVTNSSKGPKIVWDKVPGAVNYRVFVKSGSSWKKLKDTTSTSYIHTAAESGKTYTYTVRCISSTGKSYVSGYDTKGKSIQYKK